MLKEKVELLSLFTGIGAFEKALTNLNIDYNLVGFSEIDKKSITSYCAIHEHSKELNLGDISNINIKSLKNFNLMTYGFPCQDISFEGSQKGLITNTRSSLLWKAMDILKEKQPKIAIAENVQALIYSFKQDFEKWIIYLDSIGYNNYWKVLNTQDFKLPQDRSRIFIISIRKDIDDLSFKFPKGQRTELRVKDFINLNSNSFRAKCAPRLKKYINSKECKTIKFKESSRIAYYRDLCKEKLLKGGQQTNTIYSIEGISTTLTTKIDDFKYFEILGCSLSTLESFTLQGFSKEDHDKARKALQEEFYKNNIDYSHRSLWKQAGNSISVTVLEAIFKKLFNI